MAKRAQSKVIRHDHGWKAYVRRARAMRGPHVTVGVHSKEGAFTRAVGPATIVEYATFNEFGTEHIPARPAIRRTIDENLATYRNLLARLGASILAGAMPLEQALGLVGLKVQGDMRRMITTARKWADENAPATIAAKGSSSPLIDTGAYRRSINHQVHKRGALSKVARAVGVR